MKVLIGIILVLVAAPFRAHGVSTPSVVVEGATPFETECALAAMDYVATMYRELGATLSSGQTCRIVFQDEVTIDGEVVYGILGRFDSRDRTVYMLHFESPGFSGSDREGLPDLQSKYRLIVAHEIAHYFNSLLPTQPNPVLDECIAGYVQYTWLEPGLRDLLAEGNSTYEIRTLTGISMLAYRSDPEGFLLAGYRYFRDHPAVLRRSVRGNPPPVRDPSLCRTR
jgi:hypothetical protein